MGIWGRFTKKKTDTAIQPLDVNESDDGYQQDYEKFVKHFQADGGHPHGVNAYVERFHEIYPGFMENTNYRIKKEIIISFLHDLLEENGLILSYVQIDIVFFKDLPKGTNKIIRLSEEQKILLEKQNYRDFISLIRAKCITDLFTLLSTFDDECKRMGNESLKYRFHDFYENFIYPLDPVIIEEIHSNLTKILDLRYSNQYQLLVNYSQKFGTSDSESLAKLTKLLNNKGIAVDEDIVYRTLRLITQEEGRQEIFHLWNNGITVEALVRDGYQIDDIIKDGVPVDNRIGKGIQIENRVSLEENVRKFFAFGGLESNLIENWINVYLNLHGVDTTLEQTRNAIENIRLEKFEESIYSDEIIINLPDYNSMSGYEFEALIGKQFSSLGYPVRHTPGSRDQGADLIIQNGRDTIAIQVKNYTGPVGNGAIQEVVASMGIYNANKAMVISSSTYTQSARDLATANNVILWDETDLKKFLSGQMSPL